MIPPIYAPDLEDLNELNFQTEIQINCNYPFERAGKLTQMKILGPNGIFHLSIPVKKHPKGSPVSEIKIDYMQKWQHQHWRSLQSCYGRSPYFEYFQEEIKNLFYSSPQYLTDFSVPVLGWICKQYFPIKKISVILAQNLVDFQPGEVLPVSDKQDISGQPEPQRYTQVFGQEFVSGLSVWDALFCAGPNFGIRKTV